MSDPLPGGNVTTMVTGRVHRMTELFGRLAPGVTLEQARAELSTAYDAMIKQHPEAWVDFMMRFELGLEKPEPKRALQSAVTIAASYVVGGLIPLAPYMLIRDAHTALWFSIAVTLVALGAFGYIKGRFTGARALRSALETVAIGSVAAAAAFGLARLISP